MRDRPRLQILLGRAFDPAAVAHACAKIRDGSLDHRFGDVTEATRAAVVDKLTVANPAHLAIRP